MIADGISPLEPAARLSTSRRSAASCSPSTRPRFLWLGLLAVIATPIGRVIVAAVAFARDGDWPMVGDLGRRSSRSSRSASVSAIAATV